MPIKVGSTTGVLYECNPWDGTWSRVKSPQLVAGEQPRKFSVLEWVPVAVSGKERGGLFDGKPLGLGERAELCGVTGEGLATET